MHSLPVIVAHTHKCVSYLCVCVCVLLLLLLAICCYHSLITDMMDETRAGLANATSAGEYAMTELRRQREVLESGRDTVVDSNALLEQGKRIIQTLQRRTATNKIITGFIIFILLCINLFLIWYKFVRVRH
jgi:Sec20